MQQTETSQQPDASSTGANATPAASATKRIKATDSRAVRAEIDLVEGKATARTVSASEVARLAAWAEKDLVRRGIPAAARVGAKARICPAGVASSYGYAAFSTTVRITRDERGWFLDAAVRTSAGSSNGSWVITLTDAQRAVAAKAAGVVRKIEKAADSIRGASGLLLAAHYLVRDGRTSTNSESRARRIYDAALAEAEAALRTAKAAAKRWDARGAEVKMTPRLRGFAKRIAEAKKSVAALAS